MDEGKIRWVEDGLKLGYIKGIDQTMSLVEGEGGVVITPWCIFYEWGTQPVGEGFFRVGGGDTYLRLNETTRVDGWSIGDQLPSETWRDGPTGGRKLRPQGVHRSLHFIEGGKAYWQYEMVITESITSAEEYQEKGISSPQVVVYTGNRRVSYGF